MLLLLLACASAPEPGLPETEGAPTRASWSGELPQGRLEVGPMGAVLHGERVQVLAVELIEEPLVAGPRVVLVHRDAGLVSVVEGFDEQGSRWRHEGDRAALDPLGERVAFVAPSTEGLSSVFVKSFHGEPVQITNVGVVRSVPGAAPIGWEEPPVAPPLFEEDELIWQALDGEHRVALPRMGPEVGP